MLVYYRGLQNKTDRNILHILKSIVFQKYLNSLLVLSSFLFVFLFCFFSVFCVFCFTLLCLFWFYFLGGFGFVISYLFLFCAFFV